MATLSDRLQAAVTQAENDSGLLHDFMHGDANSDIVTENGSVPSLAKLVAQVQAESDLIFADCIAARDDAQAAQAAAEAARDAAQGVPDTGVGNLMRPLFWMQNGQIITGQGSLTLTNPDSRTYIDISTGKMMTASANTLRQEKEGTLLEGGSINGALHCRDLTQSVWVKTDCTPAKDAEGLDGVANAASSLTATANGATCIQQITHASEERTYSVDVRRRTGTGTVEMTDDDGATWTDITASLSTLMYTRFKVTATHTNSGVGFRFGTAGDAIEVDTCQSEALGFATSRIITTASAITRAPDQLDLTFAGNFPAIGDPVTVLMDVNAFGSTGVQMRLFTITGENHRVFYLNETLTPTAFYGTGLSYDQASAVSANTWARLGFVYDGANIECFKNGAGSGTPVTASTVSGAAVDIAIGHSGVGNFPFYGHIRSLRIHDTALSDDEIRVG